MHLMFNCFFVTKKFDFVVSNAKGCHLVVCSPIELS